MYPSSATYPLTIEGATGSAATITNFIGQEMLQKVISLPEQSILIAALPSGFYVLQLRSPIGIRGAVQFVKK